MCLSLITGFLMLFGYAGILIIRSPMWANLGADIVHKPEPSYKRRHLGLPGKRKTLNDDAEPLNESLGESAMTNRSKASSQRFEVRKRIFSAITALGRDGIHISFQPQSAPHQPSSNWLVDTGYDVQQNCDRFRKSANKHSPVLFGWIGEHHMQARDRRKKTQTLRLSLIRSTLTHVDKDFDRFVIALPPGIYLVTLGVGDPEFSAPLRFAVQGKQLWDGEPCAAGDFVSKTIKVEVPSKKSNNNADTHICGIDSLLRIEGRAKSEGTLHECAGFSTPGPDASRISFVKVKPLGGLSDSFREELADLAMKAWQSEHVLQTAPSVHLASSSTKKYDMILSNSDFLIFTSPKPFMMSPIQSRAEVIAQKKRKLSLERVMTSWASTLPRFNTIFFSQDEEIRRMAISHGLNIATSPKPHQGFGSPRYGDLFDSALGILVKKDTRAPKLFGFANSDVMFGSDLTKTLTAVLEYASSGKLIFLAGRRTDVVVPNNFQIDPSKASEQMDKLRRCGRLFIEGSADYFFMTPALWQKWRAEARIPDFVLGGVGADNYLLNLAATTPGVVSVDGTNTVTCIHQVHENLSHNTDNRRSIFNKRLMRLPWKTDGSTRSLTFFTSWNGTKRDKPFVFKR